MQTRKWFELNWIRKGFKEISLPDIIFEIPNVDCSGCYYVPRKKEILVSGRYYDLQRGLIIVNPVHCVKDDKRVPETIAHEFRHHIQRTTKFYDAAPTIFEIVGTYKESIIKYFKSSYLEMDALLFTINRGITDDATLEWYEWIVKSNGG